MTASKNSQLNVPSLHNSIEQCIYLESLRSLASLLEEICAAVTMYCGVSIANYVDRQQSKKE
jgi:hypothetical protein